MEPQPVRPQCGQAPGGGQRPQSTSSTGTPATRATRKTSRALAGLPSARVFTLYRNAFASAAQPPCWMRRKRMATLTWPCSSAVRSPRWPRLSGGRFCRAKWPDQASTERWDTDPCPNRDRPVCGVGSTPVRAGIDPCMNWGGPLLLRGCCPAGAGVVRCAGSPGGRSQAILTVVGLRTTERAPKISSSSLARGEPVPNP